jgi:capsular polysaccharide biosynthesis protein
MKILSFKNYDIYNKLFTKDNNGREINIYKFDDSMFDGINLYYPNVLLKSNDNIFLPILEKTMSLNISSIYEKYNMRFNWNCDNIDNIVNEPVFFFIYNTDNYYHFIYDTLPYLISYFEIKKNIPELKLLIQFPNPQKKELYEFINDFLEILGLIDSIIFIKSNTLYKSVYISTSYTHDNDSNLPPRQEIFDFYDTIVKNVLIKNKDINLNKLPKKIYISRRTWLHNNFTNIGTNYTTKRRLMNEDLLVEHLNNIGYQEVFTENMSTIYKILLFHNATNVIGAIGGGIANVLFSPKSTKLIAIISPLFMDINKRFIYCLEKVKLSIYDNTSHYDSDIFKKYMRVSIDNIIGEIEEIYDNTLLISYTDGSNTGWNLQNTYNQMIVNKKDVILLDNGLNSPWIINNIEKIE